MCMYHDRLPFHPLRVLSTLSHIYVQPSLSHSHLPPSFLSPHRRDPDGIFAEPVTDDIAPGYSSLISIPMDLATIATKIEMGQYSSVSEFKSDFILMCNNAMTYNAPETVYYGSAKRLLTTGLQIIAKVMHAHR